MIWIVAAEDGLHQLRVADVDQVDAERKAHGEHVTGSRLAE
jgi:hypothetical protein